VAGAAILTAVSGTAMAPMATAMATTAMGIMAITTVTMAMAISMGQATAILPGRLIQADTHAGMQGRAEDHRGGNLAVPDSRACGVGR
jgi:hypothetical protein